MQQESPVSTDVGLGIVLILVALGVIYGTLELPEGSFEPLGSASIPQYVCGGIIVLSLWMILRAVMRARQSQQADSSLQSDTQDDDPGFVLRPGLAAALVCMALVYVGVMAMDWLRFSIATAAFAFAAIGMLSKFERRLLPAIVVVALILGVGLEYTFTQVFVIDLP